jgi:DNA mismatch repair protein MutS
VDQRLELVAPMVGGDRLDRVALEEQREHALPVLHRRLRLRLHDHPVHRPLLLFATHYHELTRLAADLRCAANINVQVRESRSGIVFLYKAGEGPADRSYGIHVASMAGVPAGVTARAARVLAQLERDGGIRSSATEDQMTLPFDSAPEGLLELLRSISPDALSPRDAHRILYELREMLEM